MVEELGAIRLKATIRSIEVISHRLWFTSLLDFEFWLNGNTVWPVTYVVSFADQYPYTGVIEEPLIERLIEQIREDCRDMPMDIGDAVWARFAPWQDMAEPAAQPKPKYDSEKLIKHTKVALTIISSIVIAVFAVMAFILYATLSAILGASGKAR